MCLAVPGKVLEIHASDDAFLRSARVSFGGVVKQVSLTCAPEARVGDYVLVHVGVAISVIDEKEAEETFRYLRQMGELDGLDQELEQRERAATAAPRDVGSPPVAINAPRT